LPGAWRVFWIERASCIGARARTPNAETSKPATARKPAPKAEDGERIDPPKPAYSGAIRGAAKTSTSRMSWKRRRSAVRRERRDRAPPGAQEKRYEPGKMTLKAI
jgi:hypothetical protein